MPTNLKLFFLAVGLIVFTMAYTDWRMNTINLYQSTYKQVGVMLVPQPDQSKEIYVTVYQKMEK